MTSLAAAERWLFAPVPAARLASLRILVGAFSTIYLLARGSYLVSYPSSAKAFEPIGIVSVLDAPLPIALVVTLYGVCVLASAAATLGFQYRISGPIWGLSLLWVLTYRNCWGMLFHTENLLVLYALVLGFAPAADAWAWAGPSREAASERYAGPITALKWMLVASYVIAGVAKLRAVGVSWMDGEQLRSHIAFDALRKIELGSLHSPLGVLLVRHPGWLVAFSWLTLVFELGAPLALLGRKPALLWSAGAWLFHAGVLFTMAIFFPFPLLGIAFAPLFEVERPVAHWIVPWWQRRQSAK